MPRRVFHCSACGRKFIAHHTSENRGECESCRQTASEACPTLSRLLTATSEPNRSPFRQKRARDGESSTRSPRETFLAKAQTELVPQTDEDEEEGSEAGDELNCTQLGGGDIKSPVDAGVEVACSDDEDDDVPLIQLVRQSIYHSGVPPDQNEEIKLPFGGSNGSAASSNADDTKEIRTAIDDSSDIVSPFLDAGVRSSKSTVCFICGASLLAIQNIKGRLAHVKRCSKKNGVSAKDIRWNDDHEMFVDASSSVNSNSPKSHFKNPYAKHSLTDPVAGLTTTPALASVNNILMENARRAARIKKIQAQAAAAGAEAAAKRPGKQPWWHARNQQQKGACPWYKMIPNTDFCVDGFNYAPRTRNFFLSHFHSDHYGGITSAWDSGTIYCSLATANLVSQQLGVDRKFLHPLPPSQPVVIESQQRPVTVTTIDANHCPGAVMFLFQVGNKNILHVGDFRWNREVMQQCQPLRPFFAGQSRLDSIYLDTTYCDPKYTLPTQDAAIQEAIRFASREYERARSSKTSLLMLFGAYTIGKERIYMAVAQHLGLKVYVDARRYRILRQLGWNQSQMDLLTTRPDQTIVWVVPLGHINMKQLANYLQVQIGAFRKTFDCVVGFRPTGWTHSSKNGNGAAGSASIISTTTRGRLTVHGVPYSEHSSFPELVDCLRCLRPRRIVPTVSVRSGKEQVELLLSHLS